MRIKTEGRVILKMTLLEIIKRIQGCEDLLELKEILIEVKKELNFKHVLYAVQLPKTFTEVGNIIIGDFPEEWMLRYAEKDYIKVDPIVHQCSKSHIPFCWDQTIFCKNPHAVNVMKEAADYELIGGICIGSLNHKGGINFFSFATNHVVKTGSEECLRASLYLSSLHPYLDEAILKLSSNIYSNNIKEKLTKRELECLNWAVAGKASHEIAKILSISSPTVVFHLKNVIRKLNVKNRNQAIAQAVLLGIISPQLSSSSTFATYHF